MSTPSRAPTTNQNMIPPKSNSVLIEQGEVLLRGAQVTPKQMLLLESLTPA